MFTRSQSSQRDLAVVLISTHGGIGLRYSDDGSTLLSPSAHFPKFIDTFQVPSSRDGSNVIIRNFTATSTGVCNVVDEDYTNLLAEFIKRGSRTRDVLDPDAFIREIYEFYKPLHEDVIIMDTKEKAAARDPGARSDIMPAFDKNVVGYRTRGLNYKTYNSGDEIPNKLFVRTDAELEGRKRKGTPDSHDFTIKVLNVSDADIFDQLVFDIGRTPLETGGTTAMYTAPMSRLIDYLVYELNKKNIIIIDLTCSSFDISPADRARISERTQRRIARELAVTGRPRGGYKRKSNTRKIYNKKLNKRSKRNKSKKNKTKKNKQKKNKTNKNK